MWALKFDMNDTVLEANHTQTWLQKHAGITPILAYRNSEVGEVPLFQRGSVATMRLTSPLAISMTSM